jgi:hypothetical protein
VSDVDDKNEKSILIFPPSQNWVGIKLRDLYRTMHDAHKSK